MGYTDIHTHILYGVDDGAKDLEESMNLLEIQYQQGVTHIILTPHYGIKFGHVDVNLLRQRFEEIKHMAKERYPEMELYLGSELYYETGIVDVLKEGRALTLNGSKYVLVEFGITSSYQLIYKAIQEFVYGGYIPIIAHVERYEALLGQKDRVNDIIKAGAYLQVNVESFQRGLFNKQTKFVKKLLREEKIHFIASDCHDRYRQPNLQEWVKNFGARGDILGDNPRKLLKDKYI